MPHFPFFASARVVDGFTQDPLFIPGRKTTTLPFIMSANIQALPGTVVGQITTTGLLLPCVKTATDGSQVPVGILPEPVDTTAAGGAGVAGAVNLTIVVEAYVSASALVIDASWGSTPDIAFAGISPALRTIGIFGRFPGYSG